jgi:methyl-accepting chemotaxis protein
MAGNNMNVTINQKYIGDFIPIQTSIEKIAQSLNNTLRQMTISADNVANGSSSVSSGAQVLSQGAVEQASAIDGLASSLENLSRDVTANAEDAHNMNLSIIEIGKNITKSNEEMDKLTSAMAEIRESSAGIEKIIKTILSAVSEDTTIVVSSHLVDELETVVDSVIFMKNGKNILFGDAEVIREERGKSIVELYKEIYS